MITLHVNKFEYFLPDFLFSGAVIGLEPVQSIQMGISNIQNVFLMHVDSLVQRTVVHSLV